MCGISILPTKTQQKTVLVDDHSHNHRYNPHDIFRACQVVHGICHPGTHVIQFVTFLSPILGGHLKFPKGHVFTIPKRSQRIARILMIDVLVLATFYHSFVSCSILILVDTIEDKHGLNSQLFSMFTLNLFSHYDFTLFQRDSFNHLPKPSCVVLPDCKDGDSTCDSLLQSLFDFDLFLWPAMGV